MWHNRGNIRETRSESLLRSFGGDVPRSDILICIGRQSSDPLELVGEEVPIVNG